MNEHSHIRGPGDPFTLVEYLSLTSGSSTTGMDTFTRVDHSGRETGNG